jgi:hypothetical protein
MGVRTLPEDIKNVREKDFRFARWIDWKTRQAWRSSADEVPIVGPKMLIKGAIKRGGWLLATRMYLT